jgi:hypothetical protein
MIWYEFFLVGLMLLGGLFLMSQHNSRALMRVAESFKQSKDDSGFDINGIKEDLLDMVHDTIQNLQPPTAADHLMGMLGQFAQMKMMKSMGMDPSTGLAAIAEGLNDPPE